MQQRQQSSVLKEENIEHGYYWLVNAREKNYTTALIVSCDEFFTCFLLCSKIDEDVYDVEQNFRGT